MKIITRDYFRRRLFGEDMQAALFKAIAQPVHQLRPPQGTDFCPPEETAADPLEPEQGLKAVAVEVLGPDPKEE